MQDFFTKRLHHRYFLRDKQKVFLEDLTALIEEGVPLNQAVDTICRISEGIVERVATHVAYCIAQGKQLADGMRGWFSRSLVEVVRSGEDSGNLLKTLNAATDFISQQIMATKCFLGLVFYPTCIFITALAMVVFVRHSILDNFVATHPLSEWPNIGKSIYHIGFLIERWWWLAIVALIFIVSVVSRLLQQLTGNVRLTIDKFPLISLYRDMTAAYFMEMLGLLVKNGVAFKKALSIMHREAPPYLSWHILQMEFTLSGGAKEVADVLDTKLISDKDIIRLRAITKNNGFEDALISLGRQSKHRVIQSIMLVGRVSCGLLLLFSVLLVITLVFGVYLVGQSVVT